LPSKCLISRRSRPPFAAHQLPNQPFELGEIDRRHLGRQGGADRAGEDGGGLVEADQRDGPGHDEYQRRRGEAAQESDDQPQTAKELADGHGITERPHPIRGRFDHGRQPRPAESAEELLRAMGGKVPAIYGESYDSAEAKKAAQAG
jgi:hypothetical protein